jgi:hypothetical protein
MGASGAFPTACDAMALTGQAPHQYTDCSMFPNRRIEEKPAIGHAKRRAGPLLDTRDERYNVAQGKGD